MSIALTVIRRINKGLRGVVMHEFEQATTPRELDLLGKIATLTCNIETLVDAIEDYHEKENSKVVSLDLHRRRRGVG